MKMERSEAVLIAPETEEDLESEHSEHNEKFDIRDEPDEHLMTNHEVLHLTKQLLNGTSEICLQKLEEKATKAQEAFEKEEKMRKELEALNSKLLAEKTALLDSLSGEKGALQEYQEKTAKLTAQKNDCENQLRVSIMTSDIYDVTIL